MGAEVDKVYNDVSRYMIDSLAENSEAMDNNEQRKWVNFSPIVDSESIPIYDRFYPCMAFDRERLNKDYINVYSGEPAAGDVGKVTTSMAQLNLLAGWERDVSARFKSRIRACAHHASETNAAGSDFGSLGSSIIRSIKMIVDNNADETN